MAPVSRTVLVGRSIAVARLLVVVGSMLAPAPRALAQTADPAVDDVEGPIAVHPRARWIAPARMRSGALRAIRAALVGEVRAARRAAAGCSERRSAIASFAIGRAPAELALEGMVRARLRPSPLDDVFYARIVALDATAAPSAISAALDTGSARCAVEDQAIARLASSIATRLRGTLPGHAFVVQAGWADAVGAALHGVAFVDPGTGEALWIYAEESWSAG